MSSISRVVRVIRCWWPSGRGGVPGGGAVLHLDPCPDAPPPGVRWSRRLQLPGPRTGLADAVLVFVDYQNRPNPLFTH